MIRNFVKFFHAISPFLDCSLQASNRRLCSLNFVCTKLKELASLSRLSDLPHLVKTTGSCSSKHVTIRQKLEFTRVRQVYGEPLLLCRTASLLPGVPASNIAVSNQHHVSLYKYCPFYRGGHSRVKTMPRRPKAPTEAVPAPQTLPPTAAGAPTPSSPRRTGRNHRLPRRYRQRPRQEVNAGEYFDISQVSSDSSSCSSDDETEPRNAGPRPPRQAQLATNPTNTAVNTAVTDPLATGRSGKAQNVAYDIRHFFRKEAEQTVCLPCELVVSFPNDSTCFADVLHVLGNLL